MHIEHHSILIVFWIVGTSKNHHSRSLLSFDGDQWHVRVQGVNEFRAYTCVAIQVPSEIITERNCLLTKKREIDGEKEREKKMSEHKTFVNSKWVLQISIRAIRLKHSSRARKP